MRFGIREGLLGIVDRNGNAVEIGSDGIDTSSGLSMAFTRDAQNRITRIAAPGGNIVYNYSAAGDLIGVAYPNGTTQAFAYGAHHDLLSTSGGVRIEASSGRTSIWWLATIRAAAAAGLAPACW